jgi:hypothetical protein
MKISVAPKKKFLLDLLTALLFLWFSIATIYAAIYNPLTYDDAYNASVAKNFSENMGWVTNYHSLIPFNSTVTTGATLLLPTALAIKLLGNSLWLPNTLNAVLMLFILALCFIGLKKQIGNHKYFACAAISIIVLLSICGREAWIIIVGEGIIALLLIAAAIVSSQQKTNFLHFFFIGLLISLALNTKIYAVIASTGLAVSLIWQIFSSDRSIAPIKYKLSSFIAFFLGIISTIFPWLIYKTLVLSKAAADIRANRQAFDHDFFLNHGSGIGPLLKQPDKLNLILHNITRNFTVFKNTFNLHYLDSYAAAFIISIPFLIVGIAFISRSFFLKNRLLITLSLCAIAHWSWYLLFSATFFFPYYTRIPVLITCFIVPLFFIDIHRPLLLVFSCIVLILFSYKTQNLQQFIFFDNQNKMKISDQKNLVHAANSISNKSYLAGCDWLTMRVLDYGLPPQQKVMDSVLLLKQQLHFDYPTGMNNLQLSPAKEVSLSRPVSFLLVREDMVWGWAAGSMCPIRDVLEQRCKTTYYRNDHYSILQCTINSIPYNVAASLYNYTPLHMSGTDIN